MQFVQILLASLGARILGFLSNPLGQLLRPMGEAVLPFFSQSLMHGFPVANLTFMGMIMNMLGRYKHGPETKQNFLNEYDYIVVGAGSAGSTVAARLSEVEQVKVLLLEAGSDPPIMSEVPLAATLLIGTDVDWGYNTVPQQHTGDGLRNREVRFAAGKSLGGSSIINTMYFVRGNRKNFDDWALSGATGWSYAEVLPYFKKLERNLDSAFVEQYGGKDYHGFSGPVTAELIDYWPKLKDAVLKAAALLGYPIVDSNGAQQTGFYPVQTSTTRGVRCSTAKAYLVPADQRPNLDIVKTAFVTKLKETKPLVLNSYILGETGNKYTVRATREVILSAGAINSAKLLKLSGIGPKEELQRHGIPVVADLPVGFNFHDHLNVILGYSLSSEISPIMAKAVQQLPEYLMSRSGALTAPAGVNAMAFLPKNTNPSTHDFPDYQLYFFEGSVEMLPTIMNLNSEVYSAVYAPHIGESMLFCGSQLLNTRSRGTVTLNSADPLDPPLIDPNYLADPADIDDMLQGMKKCNEIANTEPMKRIGVQRWTRKLPNCDGFAMDSDEYLKCHLKTVVHSIWHPVGTAKMGSAYDPTTVVDEQLRVKGVRGLRVIDASVMPQITSGNTNVPVIMIAEKGADMIKQSLYSG